MGALCVKSAHTDVVPTVDGKKPVQVKQEARVLNWDDPTSDIQKQDILEWLTDRRLKVLPLPDAIGRQVEPLLEAIANLPKEAEPAIGASTANVHAYLSSLATYLSAFLDSLNKRERTLLCQAYMAACGALREKIFFKVYAALNRFNNNMIDRNDILFWLKNERSWKMKLTVQTAKAAEEAAAADTATNGTDPAAKPAETQSASDTFNITPITTADVQTAIKAIEGKLFQWQHLVVILTYEDFDRLFDRWSIRLLKLLSEDTYYYQQLTDYFKSPTLEARLALVGGHQAVTTYTSRHGSSRTGTRSTHSRHSKHSKHSRSGKGRHRKHKSRDKDNKSDADAIENDEFNPKDIEDHKGAADEKGSDEKQPDATGAEVPRGSSNEKLASYLSQGRRPSTQSVKSSSSRVTTDTSEDDRASRPGSTLNLDAASTTASSAGGSARALISPRYGLDAQGTSSHSLKKHRSRSGHGRSHRHKSSHRDKDRPQSGMLEDLQEADKRKSRRDYDRPMSGVLEEVEPEKEKEKEKDRKKHRHHSSSRHKSSSRHGTKSMPALTPELLARNAAAQLAADRELLASQGKLAEADDVLAAYQRGGASETKVAANGDRVVIEDADSGDEAESISAMRPSASASATTPRGAAAAGRFPKEFADAVNARTAAT